MLWKNLALPLIIALALTPVLSTLTADENTVRTLFIADVKGFDPCNADDVYCSGAVAEVYEALMQYSYLERPPKVVPNLADGMPQISPDGLTYTFKLKKGVRFADDPCFKATGGKGREVTARDLVYSWKRLADSRNHSYGWAMWEGKIKGINDFYEASKKAKDASLYELPVAGLQAPDDHTVVITCTEPYPQLQYVLSMPNSSVVAREAVDMYDKEFLNHPVGTGPFMVKEWVRNSKIVYVRNPNWRGDVYPSVGAPGDKEAGLLEDAGKPLPFVDRVECHIIVEDQPAWLQLLKGELDVGGIPKDNFDAAVDRKTRQLKKELADKGMKLSVTQECDITLTAFNIEDPILGKSKLLRQAMALAYDNPRRIELFYNGRAIQAEAPIPPGLFGYDEKRKNPWGTRDVEKAKQLLAAAGYPEGKGLPEFVYETMADTTGRQFAELFQRDMARIGIKVRINGNTWPEFNSKMRSKRAQIFGYGSRASYPDPEDFLSILYGPYEAPGPNATNFKNAKFDELFKKMRNMADTAERRKLIDEMLQIVYDESPWILGVHRLGFRLAHQWLKNYKPHPQGYGFIKYYRVDPQMREEKKKDL